MPGIPTEILNLDEVINTRSRAVYSNESVNSKARLETPKYYGGRLTRSGDVFTPHKMVPLY